jgi:hypothetical protein
VDLPIAYGRESFTLPPPWRRCVLGRGRDVPGADAELMRQLERAAAAGTPVEAVVVLRSRRDVPDPARTETLARELVDRVQDSTGREAVDVHVFRNLGRFVIAADAAFLRELLAQPEVDSALANRRPP